MIGRGKASGRFLQPYYPFRMAVLMLLKPLAIQRHVQGAAAAMLVLAMRAALF